MSDENKKEEIIDLDDPRLQESQHYDPEADANQFIPPPELDEQGNVIDYLLKLSLGENKFKKREAYFKLDKNEKPMGILMVDISTVSPGSPFDKAKLNPEYFNTFVNPRTNASSFTDLARLLYKGGFCEKIPSNLSVKDQASFIEPVVASEPTLTGRVQWTAYCPNCEEDKKSLQGERKWPEKEGGGHLPMVECPDCGTDLTPKVSLKRFIST